jgi:pyruvate kinase
MRRDPDATIIATPGPASSSPTLARVPFGAGAHLSRLSVGQGGHADQQARHEAFRGVGRDTGRATGTLADLQRGKLRFRTAGAANPLKVAELEVVLTAGREVRA